MSVKINISSYFSKSIDTLFFAIELTDKQGHLIIAGSSMLYKWVSAIALCLASPRSPLLLTSDKRVDVDSDGG